MVVGWLDDVELLDFITTLRYYSSASSQLLIYIRKIPLVIGKRWKIIQTREMHQHGREIDSKNEPKCCADKLCYKINPNLNLKIKYLVY